MVGKLAGQDMLQHKPPKFLMGEKINHLGSGSALEIGEMSIQLAPQIDWTHSFTFISS
jgi:hypothetical protein